MSLMAELEPLVDAKPAAQQVAPPLSRAESGYLQAIFEMAEDDLTIAQARLAERLGVSRPAVSQMMQRLGKHGVVEVHGRSVRLTPTGLEHAREAVRRHRLVERLLTDRLGLGAAASHHEADRMEHAMSPTVLEALDEYLDHPTVCPHGNPIPGSRYDAPDVVALTAVQPGHVVVVERIPERLEVTPGVLELLEHSDLVRGSSSATLGTADDGSTRVRNSFGDVIFVPKPIAEHLLVRMAETDT